MIRIKTDKDLLNEGYGKEGYYLCTCEDYEEKDFKTLGGASLYMNSKIDNNRRVSSPQIGLVHSVAGNVDFKVGDRLFCYHSAFIDDNKQPIVYIEDKGVNYVKLPNFVVIGKIEDNLIIPRKGMIIGEAVESKTEQGNLTLTTHKRRDLTKVLQAGDNEAGIKTGDYILLEESGDYLFEFNDKEYVASDCEFDDIIAVVDNEDWEINEIRRHITDYSGEKYEN